MQNSETGQAFLGAILIVLFVCILIRRFGPMSRCLLSVPPHGVPTGKDAVDQCGDRRVQRILVAGQCIFMRGGGILENADDLLFGKDVAIIEGKQQ